MADLLVTGTLALDNVRTPFGEVTDALGGSATFFAYAASFFTDVKLVAVVGPDFPKEHLDLLAGRGVDLAGVQVTDGPTFRWTGEYGYDLNEARTLDTRLGVLADFRPELPAALPAVPVRLPGEPRPGDPARTCSGAWTRPRLAALDTMNFWIKGKREDVRAVLREVDALLINDTEARMLAEEPNLVKAARADPRLGAPGRRGQAGRVRRADGDPRAVLLRPGVPARLGVRSDRGGGHVRGRASWGCWRARGRPTRAPLRRAIVYGSVIASFTVEDFSLNRLKRLTRDEIDARYRAFREMMQVER